MDQETIRLIIKLVIVVAIASTVIYVVYRIYKAISKAAKAVKDITDTIKAADQEQIYTPKSLSGVESIHLKQIKKDFPEFNVSVAKSDIKAFVNEYFVAMKEHRTDLSSFEDTCSKQFIELMMAKISDLSYTTYSQVKIHKIVISDYKKSSEEADIYFQLALQYIPSNTERLTQEKYTATYSYFIESGANGEMASVICGHCGAPVSTLGAKYCPFCDAAITAVSVDRVWKVTDLRKTTY